MDTVDTRRDFAADARLLAITAAAAVIGLFSTGVAYLLLRLIRLFTDLFFFHSWSVTGHSPADNQLGLWVIPVPIFGGLIIGLLARFGSEKIRGHGIPEAIEAILFGKSRMSLRVAILKPLSSAIAIGSGGPFGAEGPIIMTGGALGSLLGQRLRITGAERKTLLVAGAVAGMTAIFGTPIAAVMLAVELLLFELRPRSLLPVTVACAVAAFSRPYLFDSGPLFPLQTAAPTPISLLSCVIAGLACGALSWLLSTALYRIEDAFHRLPIHWMWWPAIGAAVVGLGGYLEPRALGVGYDVIDQLLTGRAGLSLILGILIVKTLIWSLSLGSGTSGGVLAPVFMIGGALGALEGNLLPHVFPGFWAMAGLAAVVGGVMRSPLTGVVFTLELTHAWDALLALLVASVSAYALSALILKRSVLTEKIARRGLHLTREYTTDPLETFFAREVMTPAVPAISSGFTVHADSTLREVANVFARNEVTRAVVLDRTEDDLVVGEITLAQLLHATRRDIHEEEHRERFLYLGRTTGKQPSGTDRDRAAAIPKNVQSDSSEEDGVGEQAQPVPANAERRSVHGES
jgi:CIC family chloride channel protein